MINRVFRASGGDGGSLAVPRRTLRIFKAYATDFGWPCGLVVTVHVFVLSKRRWLKYGYADEPKFSWMHAGPIVVGYYPEIQPAGYMSPPGTEVAER